MIMNAIQRELEQTRKSIRETISSATVKMVGADQISTASKKKAANSSGRAQLSTGEFATLMTYTNRWVEYPDCNIRGRLCGFNDPEVDMTVVNIKFQPGGYIAPHSHDRVERVYVLDGEYVDTVTGTKYRQGDVQEVVPGQIHSNKSDYALIVITWQPAYK
jgi:quercetin dioxygenase-like cupin family protein